MIILLTGASGFLGNIIRQELVEYKILSMGRDKADIVCDLSVTVPDIPAVDLVIHAAGKAHMIPRTIEDAQTFFNINVEGTSNLLKGLERSVTLPKYFVFISSVSVYGKEMGSAISEETELLAEDPYGLSKLQAEKMIKDWCSKRNAICTILRLPLLAGPHPPGNLGSLINGISKGYYLNVAGGNARKSIVLAKDVAAIVPKVASIGGIYNLTDRKHPSFSELSLNIANQLGKSKPLSIPAWAAKILARIGDCLGRHAPISSAKFIKITNDLTFDDQKAVDAFGWNPTPVLEEFKVT